MASNTDTHWRSQGFASWNWRLIFKLGTDVYTPEQKYAMEVQLWDKDVLTANDYMSYLRFPARSVYEMILSCLANEKSAKFNPPGNNRKDGKFEIETEKNPNKPDMKSSKLLMSIECLTEAEAKIRPAGVGRGDPNQDPFLPPPIGRFRFSWNPIKLLVITDLTLV